MATSEEPVPGAPEEAPPVRILVVDDEPGILHVVGTALGMERFDVRVAGSGAEAIIEARRFDPHLILLDLMLPDMDGFELFRQIARPRDVPVIFLTARDSREDTVRGLTLGADDYITKPFGIDEMVARVHAVLRRTRAVGGTSRRIFTVGGLELDDDARAVTFHGADVELTVTEFTLLRHLMQHAGRVLSKAEILEHVWAYDFGGQDNVVEVYVSYLRRKLRPHGDPPIQTIRGFGYVARAAE